MSDVPGIPLLKSSLERPEIYVMHEKSAKLLETVLNRKKSVSTQEDQQPIISTTMQARIPEGLITDNALDEIYDEYLSWPIDLSLFDNTFSDAMLQANLDESIFTTWVEQVLKTPSKES